VLFGSNAVAAQEGDCPTNGVSGSTHRLRLVGRGTGNSRNGTRTKTLLTDNVAPVDIEVPRDRDGSFTPVVVNKRQRRLDDVDTMVLSLVAKGLTTGEVSAHFEEVYGASLSKDTISRITDRVLTEMAEWMARPLEAVYARLLVEVGDITRFPAGGTPASRTAMGMRPGSEVWSCTASSARATYEGTRTRSDPGSSLTAGGTREDARW
jgi:hypothetical protein